MTTTRAASAAISSRAKQELVRLLFSNQYTRKGPEAHRRLDHSIYSYAELRNAYLERIHALHPDKKRSSHINGIVGKERYHKVSEDVTTSLHENDHNKSSRMTDTARFIELQEAWNRYEKLAKMMKRGRDNNPNSIDSNFTMFAVGCSFADNELEREERNKIMDQASKGWFCAGQLGNQNSTTKTTDDEKIDDNFKSMPPTISLTNDDLFDQVDVVEQEKVTRPPHSKARYSLISHLIHPSKR